MSAGNRAAYADQQDMWRLEFGQFRIHLSEPFRCDVKLPEARQRLVAGILAGQSPAFHIAERASHV